MPIPDFLSSIEAARNGTNPNIICRLPSGWVGLGDKQYLRGYCILKADPVVDSFNTLDLAARSQFTHDMSLVGDALLKVTGAYRINYGILSNSEPYLHAHIVPRYLYEPDSIRRYPPWSYSKEYIDSNPFDLARDRGLMADIKLAIENLL